MIQRIKNTQKGLRFDGVNDWVSVPALQIPTNYTSSFSCAMEVNVNVNISGNTFLFITTNSTDGEKGIYFYLNATRLGIALFTNGSRGTTWEIPFSFVNNVTYYIAFSYSNGTCDMYVNGVLYSNVVSDNRFGGYLTSDDTTSLSVYSILAKGISFPSFTNGICRDFKLYNRAITGSEVTQLYNKQSVTSGCLVDYRFDNQSGIVLTDNSGNGRTGTLMNYSTTETTIGSTNKWVYEYSSDPFDEKRKTGVIQQKGLRFDGVNDYLSIAHTNQIFNFGTGDFSFSVTVMIRALPIGYNGVVFGCYDGNPTYILLCAPSGLFTWFIRDSTGINQIIINTTLTINTIYNVVVMRNESTSRIYVDGVLATTGTNASLGNITTSTTFSIGGLNTGSGVSQFQNMNIYDLKAFNRALTLAEVQALHNKTGIPSNCIADYRFNQRQGIVLADHVGINNGTLINYTTPETTIGVSNKWLYEDGLAFDDTRNGGIISTNDTLGLVFDGVNEHVETITTINITSQTNSISMLCRLNSISDMVFYVNSESGNGIFAYMNTSTQLIIQRGRGATSGDARFNISLNTSTVYHFVFVYNSDLTMDLYINGVLQSRVSQTIAGSCISNLTLKIGKTTVGVPHFNGIIYDFKLFDKSLTPSEVLGLYDSSGSQIPISAIYSKVVNYSFNQTQGTVLIDTSGFSRNANLVNYTVNETTSGVGNKWTSGGSPSNNKILRNISHDIGNGLRFDGVDDYVNVPFSSLMVFEKTEAFSLSFVFSPLSFKDQSTIIDNTGTTGKGFYSFIIDDNKIGLNMRQKTPIYKERNNIATTPTMIVGAIYNTVIIYNNTVFKIYFNGVEYPIVSSGIVPDSILGSDPFRICQYQEQTGSYQANVQMYDLKFFNKALTSTEVSGLYNSRNNVIPISAIPNIVANYNFNQKQGTTLIDSSGNNLNGTLINYSTTETTIGSSNKWIDSSGNPILL